MTALCVALTYNPFAKTPTSYKSSGATIAVLLQANTVSGRKRYAPLVPEVILVLFT